MGQKADPGWHGESEDPPLPESGSALNPYWHPQSEMAAVDGHRLVLARGRGARLWDESGRSYLDATAGLWFTTIGYGRAEIAEAVAAQLATLHAYHTHQDLAARPTLDLAAALAARSPLAGTRVILTSGGSDAIETAAKLVRHHFHLQDQPGRTVLVSRTHSYHGLHGLGTSLTGIDGHRDGHGPAAGDVVQVPWDDLEALERTIASVGPARIAGFFCEPVIGTGGVRIAPAGYLAEASAMVHAAGGLVVADEVITAFGRTGAWFASPGLGLQADVIVFAKGITSGYVPLGGVLVAEHVAAPFWQPGVRWRHGYTYAGHPGAAAAGLATIGVIESERLLERAQVLEGELTHALSGLVALPVVAEVRSGVGAMAAVQLDLAAVRRSPDLPDRAIAACREAGVLTRVMAGAALQVSPPLVISAGEVETLGERMRSALSQLA